MIWIYGVFKNSIDIGFSMERTKNSFSSNFSTKSFAVGCQKNHLIEMVLSKNSKNV